MRRQELEDLPADQRVEVARRLVGDDDPRVMDERAGDRRPLLLAARQLVGVLLRLLRQPDEREHAVDGRPDLASRGAGHLEREGDVLAHGLARQELEVLEDDADLAADDRHLPARQARQVVAVEHDRAHRRELVADEQLHERGLAGARGTDEEHEVALGHDQVDVLEGIAPVRVGLRDVVEDEHRPATVGAVAVRAIRVGVRVVAGGRGGRVDVRLWRQGLHRLRVTALGSVACMPHAVNCAGLRSWTRRSGPSSRTLHPVPEGNNNPIRSGPVTLVRIW